MKTKILLLGLYFFSLSLLAQQTDKREMVYVCPPCNQACDEMVFAEAGKCKHCNMYLLPQPKDSKEPINRKIAFYLQAGVEVLDFAGPMEVFSYAGFEVFTVSKTKEPIKSQGILTILPDYSIEDAPTADIMAFFGGNSRRAFGDEAVINWLKEQKDIDYYFSVCTGAFALAEADILNGKAATTFHDALDALEENYPEVKVFKNARFVDNGEVVTTAGISAGIDGALHLVAKIRDLNTARLVAYQMEYDKWNPGEGMILTEDNPYKNMPDQSILEEYVGSFEFENGQTLALKFHEGEKSLYAHIKERSYPLFFLEKDKFLTVNGEKIYFERDQNAEIQAYKSSDDMNTLYRKLDK